ncbi:MAG: glycosyltransferase family 4 protein [Bacteroidetes bacterium]|nr:glycosyltransferase family 4 protein [Bacteroidota bacterium]
MQFDKPGLLSYSFMENGMVTEMEKMILKKDCGKIEPEISTRILTVGPEYHNHKGGIGAVIELYSRNFETFNFVSTYNGGSVVSKAIRFSRGIFKLFFTLLSKRDIKIIHIHGASYGSFHRKYFVFLIGKYLFKKKIIYHVHGGGFKDFYEKNNPFTKRMVRFFFRKADLVICVSNSWIEYFRMNFKTKKIMVLPNMVDFPEIHKNIREPETITFLFLGLVCESKGIFDLIRVIGEKKDKYSGKIKLLIGGNGETDKLNDLINKYQIGDIVEFLGWVSKVKKTDVLNTADVYILPSYAEGSPISILEAMTYGMAIISTKVGGIPELVKENQNGILIEPGNSEQIEKALDFMIYNPVIIKKFGAVSETMAQQYLPDSVLGKLVHVYQSLLSKI